MDGARGEPQVRLLRVHADERLGQHKALSAARRVEQAVAYSQPHDCTQVPTWASAGLMQKSRQRAASEGGMSVWVRTRDC